MKQAISSFIGGIKEWKRSKKVIVAILVLVALIAVKVLSITPNKLQTITPDQFRHLANDFKVELPEKFLYEK